MRRPIRVLALVLIIVGVAGPALAAGPLVLKRVVLSNGGIGYFEYETTVEGTEELSLTIPLDQVDDVLKSLTIDGARASAMLPGREPLAQAFKSLPFGPEALASPAELLNALQGAEIRVGGARAIEGRVIRAVAVETRLPGDQGTTIRHRVSVLTAKGIQEFVLEDEPAVEFVSAELRGQVEAALAAIAQNRVQDRRTVRIVAAGQGKRSIRLGYVVAAPVWKISYRLAFRNAAAKEARLQAFAVLENMSGQDWTDVDLTLTSGSPVTFRQALYASLHVDRTEAPVDLPGRLTPRIDRGAIAAAPPAASDAEHRMEMRAMPRAAPPAAGAAMLARPDVQPPPAQAEEAADSHVLFRLPQPVSARNGQSLMVPIIDRAIPAERVALYQPEVHALHPLSAIRLRNDGDIALPAGLITLYEATGASDTAHMGDARIATLPVGEERLVSFALDQRTRIDRESRQSEQIAKGKIAGGLLELTILDRQSTLYRLKTAMREPRMVVVEQRRVAGWTIAEPDAKEVQLSPTHLRVTRAVPPAAETAFTVTIERPRTQEIALLAQNADQLVAWSRRGGLDAPVVAAIRRAGEFRREVDLRQAALGEIDTRRKAIVDEQARIRDNLARVPPNSDLQRRYLARLDEQETELDKLRVAAETERGRVETAAKALRDYVNELKL